MFTNNVNVSDWLINGLIGRVKYLDMRTKPFHHKIFVKFDYPKVGNSLKYQRLQMSCRNLYQLLLEQKDFLWKRESTVIG